jgi:hypothetical protein
MKNILFFCYPLFFLCSAFVSAQVGIGTVSPATTLEVQGKPADVTVRDGITIPKLTCQQLIAKHSGGAAYGVSQTGTIIYITDAVASCAAASPVTNIANLGTAGFYMFNGTEFEKISDNSSTWTLSGNATINPTTNFIGTTDSQPLAFRTNNAEKLRLFSLLNPSLGLGRNDLAGVNGGASSFSGPTLFFGNAGNISANTGLDFVIDDDNNATNSRFSFKANGDGNTGTLDLMEIAENGNVGIGTTASPSQVLSFGGTAARTINVERNSTPDTAGSNLTVLAGGATTAATNRNGGALNLSSGTATGTGSSDINFQTTTAGVTGTADRAPTTKMTVLGNGNVGIGLMAPTQKLEVALGSMYLNSEDSAVVNDFNQSRLGFVKKSGSIPVLAASSGQPVSIGSWNTANLYGNIGSGNYTERFRISSSGNVGIGLATTTGVPTTNPSQILSLGGQAARTINVERHPTANTNGSSLTVLAGGTATLATDRNGGALILSAGTATGTGSSVINFQTATAGATGTTDRTPTTQMTILGNGNIGLGITNPSSKLHVIGDLRVTGGVLDSSGDIGTLGYVLSSTATGTDWVSVDFASAAPVQSADNGVNIVSTVLKLGGPLTAPTTISALTATNKLSITGSGVDAFNINGTAFSVDATNNRIGLGTTTPSQILSIDGNAARTINMERHTIANTAGNNLTLSAGGATTGATDKNGGNLILAGGVSTGTGASAINFQTGTPNVLSGTSNNAITTKMTVLGNGNVGIGTTSPTQSLDVSGGSFALGSTIASPMLNIRSNANTDGSGGFIEFNEIFPTFGYVIRHNTNTGSYGDDGLWFEVKNTTYAPAFGYNQAGNVGIGTTTPTSKLHVVGATTLAGTVGLSGHTTISATLNVTGSTTLNTTSGATTFGNSATEDRIIIDAVGNATPFTGTINSADLSADRTWAFPNLTGNVLLSTTSTANVPNMYSSDGTISSARTVTLGTNTLNFATTATTQSPFSVTANSLTTGDALVINTSALTTGSALNITSSNGTANVNGIIKVANTSATGAGTFATLQANSTAGSGLTILNNGRVGIGTTAPDQVLSVNGDASKVGGGSWATFSDARVKKNITNYTKGLNEIMAIRPVSFQYNENSSYRDQSNVFVGVIAQEIEKILPRTVTKTKTETFEDLRQYNSSELTYTLINAVKELKMKEEKAAIDIQDLKSIIEAMRVEINELKNKR